MSVSTLVNEASGTVSGGVASITCPFPITDDDDIEVQNISVHPNTVLTKGAGNDYTVDGYDGLLSTGSWDTCSIEVLDTAASANGDVIRCVRRTIENTNENPQSTDYTAHSAFPASSHEGAIDKLTILAIDQRVENRTIWVPIVIGAKGTSLAAGPNQGNWICPYASASIYDIYAEVATAATGATLLTLQITKNGSDQLTTEITLDASETTSRTAVTPYVATADPTAVSIGDHIGVDIDAVGNTTPGEGLVVWMKMLYVP